MPNNKAMPHKTPKVGSVKNKPQAQHNAPPKSVQKPDATTKSHASSSDKPKLDQGASNTHRNVEKDDWEREVLTIMSKYHNKQWEIHLSGGYVEDIIALYGVNKNVLVDSRENHGTKGFVGDPNLDKPPDIVQTLVIDVNPRILDGDGNTTGLSASTMSSYCEADHVKFFLDEFPYLQL
ncbi:AraC family transcriptional regulator [Sesbania bispinosa]|nr:AraC family transcriptional regulator [Sesbania bispinosa]